MISNLKYSLIATLIVGFVLVQTPVLAEVTPAPQKQSVSNAKSLPVKTMMMRVGKDSHETPEQIAADLQLLTPSEISMLAANPAMMSVGGSTVEVDDTVLTIVLVGLAVVLVIVIVAVAVD